MATWKTQSIYFFSSSDPICLEQCFYLTLVDMKYSKCKRIIKLNSNNWKLNQRRIWIKNNMTGQAWHSTHPTFSVQEWQSKAHWEKMLNWNRAKEKQTGSWMKGIGANEKERTPPTHTHTHTGGFGESLDPTNVMMLGWKEWPPVPQESIATFSRATDLAQGSICQYCCLRSDYTPQSNKQEQSPDLLYEERDVALAHKEIPSSPAGA